MSSIYYKTGEETGRSVFFTCDIESDRKRRGSWKGGTEKEGTTVLAEVKGTVCQANKVTL